PKKDLLTGFLCCFGRGKTRCSCLDENPVFDAVQHVERRFVGSVAARSERSTEQANEENKSSSPQIIDHDRFLEKIPGSSHARAPGSSRCPHFGGRAYRRPRSWATDRASTKSGTRIIAC